MALKPSEVWVRLQVFVPLPSGEFESILDYYGKVVEAVTQVGDQIEAVELVTRHAIDEGLSQGFTKWSAGDEYQVLGSNW